MTHIEPINPRTADLPDGIDNEARDKINEITEVLNSLTEKKIPHAHCKCMNLDEQCPNYHFATCPICKPEKTAESEVDRTADIWAEKFDEIVELHVNGEDTRKQFGREAKKFILSLLTSHTEQKKKELIEKIAVNEVWMKHEIFDLIKEL